MGERTGNELVHFYQGENCSQVFLVFFFFVKNLKEINYEDQVTDNNRGIESPDLEKVDDRCPEKVMSIFDDGEYSF